VYRGVFRYHTGGLVASGNDGHSEPNTRREVEPFREWLAANGHAVERFATDAEN
jgi:hypothetical protein